MYHRKEKVNYKGRLLDVEFFYYPAGRGEENLPADVVLNMVYFNSKDIQRELTNEEWKEIQNQILNDL